MRRDWLIHLFVGFRHHHDHHGLEYRKEIVYPVAVTSHEVLFSSIAASSLSDTMCIPCFFTISTSEVVSVGKGT